MGTYYIKDLESITGIKAHTIRIWEQRHSLIFPKRTATNIRYYDDEDVKLLLNISLLNKKGLKISKIATLTRKEIQKEALLSSERGNEFEDLLNTLILATYNLNEDEFNRVFANFASKEGFENTILKLAFPLLQRLGDLWVSNALHPALEHFASNIVKKKLEHAIDSQNDKKPDFKRFLLFLPPGEMHELSLLFANYMIRHQGHEVVYLGQNTPLHDLTELVKCFKIDYLLTVFTNCKVEVDPAKFANDIHLKWPEVNLILSGSRILNDIEGFNIRVNHLDKIKILNHPSQLNLYLSEIK